MCAYAVDFDFHKIQSASLKAAGVSANASTTRQAAGNKSQTKTAVKSQNPRLPNSTAPISQPSSSSSASTSSNVSLPLGTTSTSSTSTSQNTRVQLFTTPSLPSSSSNKAVASSGISVTSDNRPIPSAPPLQFQDQEIGQDTAPPTYEEAMGEDYASVVSSTRIYYYMYLYLREIQYNFSKSQSLNLMCYTTGSGVKQTREDLSIYCH